MYLKGLEIGISIYAYNLITDDDVLFFRDANDETVCIITQERVDRVMVDTVPVWITPEVELTNEGA